MGEVAVTLGEIESVADDELVGNFEADKIGLEGDLTAAFFVEQYTHPETGGTHAAHHASDEGKGFSGIQNIVDNQDVAVGHIEGEAVGVTVGADARIGPFARLRPGAVLADEVHIGNFVEVKNTTMAQGSKANHLAYLGDATVGERVNYGAGSITANYDGVNKHRTVIEADVHVGSNSVLVAPVTIGAGGTIGGGSTITKDTPPGALTVARGKQTSIANWKRPQKKR